MLSQFFTILRYLPRLIKDLTISSTMTARKTPAIPSLRTNTNKSATETTHNVPNNCVMSIHIVLPLPLIALPTTMFADFAKRLMLIKIRYIPHDAIILLSLVKSDMICCGNARQTPSVMIPTTIPVDLNGESHQ